MKKALVTLLTAALLIGSCLTVNAAGLKDVFNAKYYADQYPDLKAAFGYDEELLYQHFLEYGLKEGRNMSPVLDVRVYREKYADLDAAFGDNWDAYVQHFFDYGIKENRDNGTNFDVKTYIEAYGDIKEAFGDNFAAVVEHYLTYGIAENRVLGNTDVYVAQNSPSTGAQPEGGVEDTNPDEGGSDVSGGDAGGDDTTGGDDVTGGDNTDDDTTPPDEGGSDVNPGEGETENLTSDIVYYTDGSYAINYYNEDGEKVRSESYTSEDVLTWKEELENGKKVRSWSYNQNQEVSYYQEYVYDQQGRLTENTGIDYTDGEITGYDVTTYEYSGNTGLPYVKTWKCYDENNVCYQTQIEEVNALGTLVKKVVETESSTEEYYYDGLGELYKWISIGESTKTIYEYYQGGELIAKSSHYTNDELSMVSEYEYDDDSNKETEVIYFYMEGNLDRKTVKKYDITGNIELEEHYWYDDEGNWIKENIY